MHNLFAQQMQQICHLTRGVQAFALVVLNEKQKILRPQVAKPDVTGLLNEAAKGPGRLHQSSCSAKLFQEANNHIKFIKL